MFSKNAERSNVTWAQHAFDTESLGTLQRSNPKVSLLIQIVALFPMMTIIVAFLTRLGCFQLITNNVVRPDMRYCSRSRFFHPYPGTKHISVPSRHMTMSYAPDFQHDITTLQIQGYNISYNRHTSSFIQYNSGRYMSEYKLQSNAYWQREKHRSP